jgi:hypothetical protein
LLLLFPLCGKPSYIIGDNKEKDPGPFTLKPVALPK